jgi:phosphatidylserine/phosphatidylglycerophosphate/cardiolipin synthase-like enzyme
VSAKALGLVSLADLERLVAGLRRGTIRAPLTAASLLAANLEHLAPALGWARTLDAAVLADVLDVVAAERASHRRSLTELVWTGPEAHASTLRDTAVVVRELFESAQKSAIVGVFWSDDSKRHGGHRRDESVIFAPLHRAMKERGVTVSLYLHIDRAPHAGPTELHLNEQVGEFLRTYWPFGGALPDLFYDPRTLPAGSLVSMHAKCIVIDDARALVTSANFTNRGQTRNLEVGTLVEDAAFAVQLAGQWRAVTDAGLMRRWIT